MACLSVYAEVQEYIDLWCLTKAPIEVRARIETGLKLSAGVINLARASVDGCSCTLSDEGDQAMSYLSCLMAAVLYNCPCVTSLDTAMRQMYSSQVISPMLNDIRSGALELCEGATGSTYPAVGYAAIGWTAENRARIYANRVTRLGEEE